MFFVNELHCSVDRNRYSYRPVWYCTDYLSVVPNPAVKSKGSAFGLPGCRRDYTPVSGWILSLFYELFRAGRGRAEQFVEGDGRATGRR